MKKDDTNIHNQYTYNNEPEPFDDYSGKFSEMRIDDELNPEEYQSEQIRDYYQKQLESQSNNYYVQAQEKSRISPTTPIETEVMGTIATERAVSNLDSFANFGQSQNNGHSGHKRKQSANIPYKMSMPHTNIEKMHAHEKISPWIPTYPRSHYQNSNDEVGEEDEEWNIGEEAEEAPDYYDNFKQPKSHKGSIRISGYDRNFRSNTTKSGSSSLGQYKQTEAAYPYGFSTEDDEDNFLTLEWDENLYEEDRLNDDLEEEEKVLVHPTKVKQSFVGFGKKNEPRKEISADKEAVNDTIPDFGFVGKQNWENPENTIKENKIVLNKNPEPGKYPKKLKIK